MSRRCINTVAMMSLILAAGCRGRSNPVAPSDPFAQIAVSRIPVNSLAASNVLLLTAGVLVVGDSSSPLPEVDVRRTALLAAANATLDTAVRRDAREVIWLGVDDQRRIARRNPTLGLEPDHFATQLLFDPRINRVPDPLWSQVRSLAAVASARYVLVPAAVKIGGSAGALTASYVMVLADTRSGSVLARIRAQGAAAPTPEAALALAAGSVIASPLH